MQFLLNIHFQSLKFRLKIKVNIGGWGWLGLNMGYLNKSNGYILLAEYSKCCQP